MSKSSTLKEQEQLIEILKFTPRTYTLYIGGYGGEAYAGKVDRKIYDFFKEHKIDLDEYAGDWDGKFEERVPAELQPFNPGSPYDCDGLFHCSGAELSNLNELRVDDEQGNEHWTCAAGYNDLEDQGVAVNETGGCDFDDLPEDTVVFWGGQGEKGSFFEGEIELREPFDPKKLSVYYENCDGWYIISRIEYDGEEIDGSNGYSTTGKWSENKWVLCNGEEVYEPVSCEDLDDEESKDGDAEVSSWPEVEEPAVTDWFTADVKPAHKGEYDVVRPDVQWPNSPMVRAEWTGRTWKYDDKKVVITKWRGLAEEPNQ